MAQPRPKPRSRSPWRAAAWGGGAAAALVLAVLAIAPRHEEKPPSVTLAMPPAPLAAAPPELSVAAPPPPEPAVVAPMPLPPELPPWRRFAAAPEPDARPGIAIVIDDLGPDRVRTARAMALPAAVTLSFLPYAGEVREEAAAARSSGHELLVHVPMEPLDGAAAMGAHGLAVAAAPAANLAELRWDLARFDAYVGVNNHMGSRFTASEAAMAPVLEELKSRGLLFLDSRTTGASVAARLAQRLGLPFAERDVFLDDEIAASAIAARLAETETRARRTGTAIAIGHPHDATLAALAAWIETLPGKGLALIPLTGVVTARAGALVYPGSPRAAALSPARR